MKTISLVRHSEAVSGLGGGISRDFDRPLTDNGIHLIEDLSEFCSLNHINPDFVICSPSARTRQTWEWLCGGFNDRVQIEFVDKLYEATEQELIDILRQTNSDVQHLMVICHNPSISEVAEWFSSSMTLPEDVSTSFRPAQLMTFSLMISDWNTINPSTVGLKHYFCP